LLLDTAVRMEVACILKIRSVKVFLASIDTDINISVPEFFGHFFFEFMQLCS